MSKSERVEFDEPQQSPVIGDELVAAFRAWLRANGVPSYKSGEVFVTNFVEWLLRTGDGAVALRRINDFPRQLFLPFTDDSRPWRVVRADEDGS